MAEVDPVNEFLNEASKTAAARVNIIRTLHGIASRWADKQALSEELHDALSDYDRDILRLDLEGTY